LIWAFTRFDPDEQNCELYNVDEGFLSGQDWALTLADVQWL
jgi:hypothetical protein